MSSDVTQADCEHARAYLHACGRDVDAARARVTHLFSPSGWKTIPDDERRDTVDRAVRNYQRAASARAAAARERDVLLARLAAPPYQRWRPRFPGPADPVPAREPHTPDDASRTHQMTRAAHTR